MIRLLLLALVAYVFVVVMVYVFQRSLQYHPARTSPGNPKDVGLPQAMQVVTVQTDDGLALTGWFMPPAENNGRVIVFFHGNAGHIGHRAIKAAYLIEAGYGVYFAEYRGYGGNPGTPSEDGFYKDARAALGWLRGQGYVDDSLVLYGESIGTGVAVQMAQEIQPRALILEAPFTSATDVAKIVYYYFPIDLLMKDRFDNLKKIKKIKTSLLIVHGDEDTVIPIAQAKTLYEAAHHPKEFVTINGGAHNDLYDHHTGHIVREWLDRQ